MDERDAYAALVKAALKLTAAVNVVDGGLTKHPGGPRLFTVTNGRQFAQVWFEPKRQLFHWKSWHCQGASRMITRIAECWTREDESTRTTSW